MAAFVIMAGLCCGGTGDVIVYQPPTRFDIKACFHEARAINRRWLEDGRHGVAVCRRAEVEAP